MLGEESGPPLDACVWGRDSLLLRRVLTASRNLSRRGVHILVLPDPDDLPSVGSE